MNRARALKVLAPIAVVLAAGLIVLLLVLTRERPQSAEARPGKLVETQQFAIREQRVVVPAAGTVRPAVRATLLPQVSGRVVRIHPNLVPGGRVAEGDTLVQLERRDFELRIEQAAAELARARAEYQLERGRREVAQREWRLFADEVDEEDANPQLALREPQLATAKARVSAAAAALAEARLALERTTIEAPFDAVVLSEQVDPGQLVSSQSAIAELVGADRVWVQASVPVERLPFIDADPQTGSLARIRHDAGALAIERTGRVTRVLGDLEEAGRMARVLIEVDASAQDDEVDASLPFLLNAWVDVRIEGNRELAGVMLPRKYLRDGDEVWIYEEGALAIRPVEVAWETPDAVFVTDGLGRDDRVIGTRLASPVEGMSLRLPSQEGGEQRGQLARESADDSPAG